ncbi:hypothetical protein GCM10009796_20770 [Microbacterium koreense]
MGEGEGDQIDDVERAHTGAPANQPPTGDEDEDGDDSRRDGAELPDGPWTGDGRFAETEDNDGDESDDDEPRRSGSECE